ncbi:hypothetical protein [Kitasatospora sp. SC0581]|uniref:hypothetical protein n=1 Tax=Kitasatospora sp. SC0581 TaxID=3394360 RepID=UPI003A893C99
MLTLHGSRTESVGEWWGSGWYVTATRRAIARAASDGGLPAEVSTVFPDTEHLAAMAAAHSGLLDDDVFAWITGAVFKEGSLRRKARLPVPSAMTLPEWAAHGLLDNLRPDLEEDEPPVTDASPGQP